MEMRHRNVQCPWCGSEECLYVVESPAYCHTWWYPVVNNDLRAQLAQESPYRFDVRYWQGRVDREETARIWHDANAMPGTYVTGGSNVPRSRLKRIDREFERTLKYIREIKRLRERLGRERFRHDQWITDRIRGWEVKPPKKPRRYDERLRMLRKAHVMLSLDGVHELPLSDRTVAIHVLVGWDYEHDDSVGIIRVVDGDDVAEYQAASIQGVDLEEMADMVMRKLLGLPASQEGQRRSEYASKTVYG